MFLFFLLGPMHVSKQILILLRVWQQIPVEVLSGSIYVNIHSSFHLLCLFLVTFTIILKAPLLQWIPLLQCS